MLYVELKDFAENFAEYVKQDYQFISYNNEAYALRGTVNDCNEEYCLKNNIKIIDIKHTGGTIVLSQTAVGYAIIHSSRSFKPEQVVCTTFVTFLRGKGLNAEYKDNDILIDGYKVGSAGSTYLPNGMVYTPIQFSLDNDAELISKICLKPMDKVPKGLSDFGITREDVLNFLENVVAMFDKLN